MYTLSLRPCHKFLSNMSVGTNKMVELIPLTVQSLGYSSAHHLLVWVVNLVFLCSVYDKSMERARQGHIQSPIQGISNMDFGGRSESFVSCTIHRSILVLARLVLELRRQNDRLGVFRVAWSFS